MDELKKTPHLVDLCFIPIYKCIQNHAIKGSFPQSREILMGLYSNLCMLVDVWPFVTICQGNEIHIVVIARDL